VTQKWRRYDVEDDVLAFNLPLCVSISSASQFRRASERGNLFHFDFLMPHAAIAATRRPMKIHMIRTQQVHNRRALRDGCSAYQSVTQTLINHWRKHSKILSERQSLRSRLHDGKVDWIQKCEETAQLQFTSNSAS